MPFPYIALSSFQVSCKKPNAIKKKYLNPTGEGGGGEGGHKVMDWVLLCNSGKTVLTKKGWSHFLCMMASTLSKHIYKERRERPKKCEFILNELDKKRL